jgi:hypothetical protein
LRLPPDEDVVWATRKGLFNLLLILAVFGMAGGLGVAFFGFGGGTVDSRPLQPNPALGWLGVALILSMLAYVIVSLVVAKSTKYVLTNRRLMEIRFGKIVKEISLASFMGKPISNFFDKGTAGTVNSRPVFNVRITDPKSLNDMEFKSLNESAVEAFERILENARQVIRCEYCKTDNSASSARCSHCDAPLRSKNGAWSVRMDE